MKLGRSSGQRCTFRATCHRARQASLVIDIFPGMSQIFPMQQTGEGVWEIELRLHPGEYRFCYHLYDGRSLQYVTPAGMPTDGLKAVLCVKPLHEPADSEAVAQRRNVFCRRPLAPLTRRQHLEAALPGLSRRAAG